MSYSARFFALLCALFCLCASPIFAQIPTGTPQFGTFNKGSIDTINLATLNVHLEIPVMQTPGRGLPFSAVLNQDTAIWYPGQVVEGAYRYWYWLRTGSVDPNWNNEVDPFPLRTSVLYGIPMPNSVQPQQPCTSSKFIINDAPFLLQRLTVPMRSRHRPRVLTSRRKGRSWSNPCCHNW